jgi:hypothetical protein
VAFDALGAALGAALDAVLLPVRRAVFAPILIPASLPVADFAAVPFVPGIFDAGALETGALRDLLLPRSLISNLPSHGRRL